MHEGLRKFYSGEFYGLGQVWHNDGTVTITLWDKGSNKKYRFRVRNLREIKEKVVESAEIVTSPTPVHILQRMKEAREHGRKRKAKPG